MITLAKLMIVFEPPLHAPRRQRIGLMGAASAHVAIDQIFVTIFVLSNDQLLNVYMYQRMRHRRSGKESVCIH